MPVTETTTFVESETVDFETERERLRDEMEEVAEQQLKYEDDGQRAQELLVRGNELNNQCNVLELVEDEWGPESITLSGLTTGDVNQVEDTVEEHPNVRERDAWVAIGTVDAPYLEHDPNNIRKDEFEETLTNVADLPLAYVRWAEAKISDLSHLSEETGNGYLELVQEKRGEESPTTNG